MEAVVGNSSLTLRPVSNNFTLLGTNSTGTFVVRTMQVSSGTYSGVFKIVYKATSQGPLRWDLVFTPSTLGQYRMDYDWTNTTTVSAFSRGTKQFRAGYQAANYTFSYDDVSSSLNTTTDLSPTSFRLSISLGNISAGSSFLLDPSIVATGAGPISTANTDQRRVFYEPKGGYYFLFYLGSKGYGYSNSSNGVNWSPEQPLPSPFTSITSQPFLPAEFNLGQSIVVAGITQCGSCGSGGSYVGSIVYMIGQIAGSNISWGSVGTAGSVSYPCQFGDFICGVRDLNVAITATGQLAFSFEFTRITGGQYLANIYGLYLGGSPRLFDAVNSNTPGSADQWSALVPSDNQGGVQMAYKIGLPNGLIPLRSVWFNGSTNGTFVQLDSNSTSTSEFSMVADSDYGVHVVWRSASDGNVSYDYHSASSPSWAAPVKNIFSGPARSPTLTVDASTNDVYAMAVQGSSSSSSIVMKKKASPDSYKVKYTYDGLGRVVTVANASIATFTYYPNDLVRSIVFGNGKVGNYTYDSLGRTLEIKLRPTAISTSPILLLDYSYNKTGTVARVTGQVNGATVNEQYRYDALRRLIVSNVTSGGSTKTTANSVLQYKYDSVGNRVWQSLNSRATSYLYNATNNELRSSNGALNATYTYDLNGKLKAKSSATASWSYTWDAANRLVTATNNGATQGLYAYDGTGRRIESVESSTIFYPYYGTETLSEIVSGGTTTDYVYAGGLRIAKITGTTTSYYHTDALGSTRLVTDSSSKAVFADGYQPYGQDNGTPSGSETYKFTGKPYSAATGLYYDYQRWHDNSTGRFLSEDPIAGYLSDPQSQNGYVYARDLPTVLVDPAGAGFECADAVLCADVTPPNTIDLGFGDDPTVCEQNPFICGGWTNDNTDPIKVDCLCPSGDTSPPGRSGSGGSVSSSEPGPTTVTVSGDTTTPTTDTVLSGTSLSDMYSNANFASQNELSNHFEDHGGAMGYQSANDYLNGARDLLNPGVNGQAEYYVRYNGDMISVDPETGRLTLLDR